MSNIKPLFVVIFFIVISLLGGSYIHQKFIGFSGGIVSYYYESVNAVKNSFIKHFNQATQIENLRSQNEELQKSTILLSTFAEELNRILKDKNSTAYEPKVQLARVLSYATLNDYDKFWLDFKDFNQSKIYGLIENGKTAGIVLNKDNRPLAVLQRDRKSAFSVFIGKNNIPGLAVGNSKNISIKFIPQWLEPKVGDEVFTSGLDGIFFSGIPVGIVKEIKDEELYKSAVIEPYANPNMPTFLYVVTKER